VHDPGRKGRTAPAALAAVRTESARARTSRHDTSKLPGNPPAPSRLTSSPQSRAQRQSDAPGEGVATLTRSRGADEVAVGGDFLPRTLAQAIPELDQAKSRLGCSPTRSAKYRSSYGQTTSSVPGTEWAAVRARLAAWWKRSGAEEQPSAATASRTKSNRVYSRSGRDPERVVAMSFVNATRPRRAPTLPAFLVDTDSHHAAGPIAPEGGPIGRVASARRTTRATS